MSSPNPPAHLFGSVEFRVMRAWIEAEQAHPGDERAVLAAVATEIERYQHGRRLQLVDTWTSLPDWIRAITAKPAEERMKALMGDWTKGGQFRPADGVPARWRLTEDEARVYGWEVVNGMTFAEIQRELTPKGVRRDRERWVDAEDVEALLESAHAKVRGMFGLE